MPRMNRFTGEKQWAGPLDWGDLIDGWDYRVVVRQSDRIASDAPNDVKHFPADRRLMFAAVFEVPKGA
jgi:hypothetical protein